MMLMLSYCKDLYYEIKWHNWVEATLESWMHNRFLILSIALMVTIWYGQNQEVNSHPNSGGRIPSVE